MQGGCQLSKALIRQKMKIGKSEDDCLCAKMLETDERREKK
jgi:hypothetical protein